MIAALKTKLIAADTFYMAAASLLLDNCFALPAYTTAIWIVQILEICALACVHYIEAIITTNLGALTTLQNMLILGVYALNQGSIYAFLASSDIGHPIVVIKKFVYFPLILIWKNVVDAFTRVIENLSTSFLST